MIGLGLQTATHQLGDGRAQGLPPIPSDGRRKSVQVVGQVDGGTHAGRLHRDAIMMQALLTSRRERCGRLPVVTTSSYTIVDSPAGPLTLVATDGVLSGLYMQTRRHAPDPVTFGRPRDDDFDEARSQLADYFAGRRTTFELPLAPRGTPFQQEVWAALRTIPYGVTWSYRELTAALGRPATLARAVGAANGRNPISIVVPCHRVIGSDGSLVGYGGGLERKRFLLDLEAAHPGPLGSRVGSRSG